MSLTFEVYDDVFEGEAPSEEDEGTIGLALPPDHGGRHDHQSH